MAKGKKDEADAKDGDYEFKLPAFDEKAFIRREVASAKASFYTVGIGVLAGLLAWGVFYAVGWDRWYYGWVPLALALFTLRPLLLRLKFPEEIVKPRALFGSYFMMFFTGLAVWILAVNVLPPA
jgi:hypothetical protein